MEDNEVTLEDYSVTNPGLHALYVKWAVQTLVITKEALDTLEARSNWQALKLSSALRAEMISLIETEAAYRDAAAIIFSGVDTAPYFIED